MRCLGPWVPQVHMADITGLPVMFQKTLKNCLTFLFASNVLKNLKKCLTTDCNIYTCILNMHAKNVKHEIKNKFLF